MALFAPTAESLGWIVMSAARSMSDGPTEPNEAALGAMLDYAERSLRVNTQRLYIAGMSGTARAAWSLAKTYRVNVAGVIGAAASVTRPMDAREFADDSTFAAALTVGTADFNYAEVRTLRDDLARQHTPARVEWFNGPHGWMPAPAAARAMRWLELRAMLGGRRAVDTAFVSAWVTSERARGDSLLAYGEMDGAEVAWREAASVAGLASQSMSHAADSLSAMRRLRDYRGALREAITEEGDRPQRMGVVMAWERIQPEPPAVKDLLSRLEVPALISQMLSRDSVRARSARRQLSYIVAMLSFYAPRAYEGAQQPARAARLREAAAIIRASR
jgi:predicted esterase